MALSVLNLALANSGDKKIASGVSSVTVDGTTLHFTFTNGQSADMVFPTPQDGADGISVTGVTVDENNEVTVTFSDGSTQSAGTIATVQGEKGESGYSPTATITQDADGATISITDKNGTSTAAVKNGKDGQADPEQIAEAISGAVSAHNTSETAHSDIRTLLTDIGDKIPTDYVKTADLGEYAKSADVTEEINTATADMATNTAVDAKLEDYAKSIDLADYATHNWVEGKHYLTEHQDLSAYALIAESGYSLGLSIDSDYIMTLELKNKTGSVLDTKKIDFPIESMVIGASYADGKLTLTLQNGETTECDISAIVGGLVANTLTIAGIDLKDAVTKEELLGALELTSVVTDISSLQTSVEELQTAKANTSDLAAVATSGSYTDLTDTPMNVSVFANDAGYLTEHQDLSSYATREYVDNAIDDIIQGELYGFKIDQNESDPASMISYIADNRFYQSAYMDYETDKFNYGDWSNAFFMKVRPCMLKYDGTVDYYLNPNDYSLKEDGTVSDIADDSYEGNAMIQFPKIYWKITDNGDNTANVYICNKQYDNDYHCWSHIDNNGNEIDHCYMPIYNGYNDGTRLRSLSGKTPIYSQSGTTEISLATANNQTDDVIWYTEVYSDRVLVNLLLLLIGKSTDTQTVFGNGYYTGGSETSNPRIDTGTMNAKGLFWGSNGSLMVGVKVFGMEHWWGNQWRRIAGWINDNGTQKVKMTYGKSDGSTVDGYNTTGSGYITISNATPSGASGGYISEMVFSKNGLIPKTASGSATTYYTDGLWFNNSYADYALVGGVSNSGLRVGALCSALHCAVSHVRWNAGAAVSCKPLA